MDRNCRVNQFIGPVHRSFGLLAHLSDSDRHKSDRSEQECLLRFDREPASPGTEREPGKLELLGTSRLSQSHTGQRERHKHRGWIASFTGVSDQSWLALSASSGTAPSTLQVSPSITALKAGNYTGHVTLTGGGVSKIVTVALTVTAPPVQHTIALSWKPSAGTNVVSYRMYRSTIAGSSYAMLSSAIGGASYTDQSVQAATSYYYVVTAVDDQGRESAYSSEIRAVVP